jgi:hypothetical protein
MPRQTPLAKAHASLKRATATPIVYRFRLSIEGASDCDKRALRATLDWAFQTQLPVTPIRLRSVYQIMRQTRPQ